MGVLPRWGSGRLQLVAFFSLTGKDSTQFQPNNQGISGLHWRGGTPMSELPKRMLGRTGLQVTTLGYGAMELRGAPRGPEVSDHAAEKVLNAVLDAGINF